MSKVVSKKILFIINGMVKSAGVVSVSGGDVRLLEIVKNIGSDYEKNLLTTPNGKSFFDKYPDISYKKMYILQHDLRAGVLSNLIISIKSFFLPGVAVSDFKDGIVYSSSEHIYDVLPAVRYKIFNRCTWYAVYHWVEDYPWKEKRGNTPLFHRYAYWLNRYISGWIIKKFSDEILAVSDPTREKLVAIKKIPADKIKAVYCGVNYGEIRSIAQKHIAEAGEQYDAVFMKRLNYGKGVFDLLRIWEKVVAEKPQAKLAIIGDGSEEVILKIKEFLKNHMLEDNVDLLGVIYDTEQKFRIINSAKVFLLPTHEENWAIVVGEAMAAGVPVVVSKLKEITPIWKDNVVWCEVGDIDSFAQAVLNIVDNPKEAKRISDKALEFITRYDWTSIGRDELQ